MAYEEYYRAREFMVDYLERDLLGPRSEDEELRDDPTVTYICGVLYPRRADREETDNPNAYDDDSNNVPIGANFGEGDNVGLEVDGDDDGSFDIPISLANSKNPSSIALTFQIDANISKTLSIKIRAAHYMVTGYVDDSELQLTDQIPKDDAAISSKRRTWKRVPIDLPEFEIDLFEIGKSALIKKKVVDGLEFFCRVRSIDTDTLQSSSSVMVLTGGLTNTLHATYEERDEKSFFQPSVEIRSGSDQKEIFVERQIPVYMSEDPDFQSSRLIYRHSRSFAVGHGCAASWEPNNDGTRGVSVFTSILPKQDVNLTDSNDGIKSDVLGMHFLVSTSKDQVVSELRSFAGGYKAWIDSRKSELPDISDPKLGEVAASHIREAELASGRIHSGIDLLNTDPNTWKAFILANHAMLSARSRTDWMGMPADLRAASPEDNSSKHRWRPFQLAFILMCLNGISGDSKSDDRSLVDLLWFPTGGGKTEAYLGLIAFTLFLRRIKHGNSGQGTSVLMRYTMRLLTTQQFQRATLLICACERLRIDNGELGDAPLSIGLYVGEGGSPNRHESNVFFNQVGTIEALETLRAGRDVDEGNPVQLRNCPWCGTKMNHLNYAVEASGNDRELVIRCSEVECPFSTNGDVGRLPVFIVDEDIYRRRPSFLIGTVDKFASLPWNSDNVKNLFNIGFSDPPPELIIQDELHLISGPLGTLTGLYETAIDILCRTEDGCGPKIIASTATIRKAQDQCLNLFGRPVFQFPPPGLDSRDSYFSVEMPRDQKGSRLYLGLFAPGSSATTLLVRTYAALLQGAEELNNLENLDPKVLDAYWTMVGYFNARRLLGSAVLQVHDDVSDRISVLANRTGAPRRSEIQHIELSGRSSGGSISDLLDIMETPKDNERSVDVVLATNMISVGVDINRLGLMAVMGQPTSWSEYIQATSRVGRQFPGLVTVMLNAYKSRDRSHYESFESNHGALYRQVEATSVTPFSPRARDKGLHAIIIGLARIQISQLRQNSDASNVDDWRTNIDEIVTDVLARVRLVAPEEYEATKMHAAEILSNWALRAESVPDLSYRGGRIEKVLLIPAEDAFRLNDIIGPEQDRIYPTMQSLRNVDTESKFFFAFT